MYKRCWNIFHVLYGDDELQVLFCEKTVSLQSEQTRQIASYKSASIKYKPVSEQDSKLKQLQTCSHPLVRARAVFRK